MDAVVSPEHATAARILRGLVAAYEEKRDLIALGAYSKGSDARVDQALTALPEIERFLQQSSADLVPFEHTISVLKSLADRYR